MPYETRHGCTRKTPKGFRHDPANNGIFIHGGTCCAGPFYQTNTRPNQFGVTWPSKSEASDKARALLYELGGVRLRTFDEAKRFALRVRDAIPELHGCAVFACTDLMTDGCAGKVAVQRVG